MDRKVVKLKSQLNQDLVGSFVLQVSNSNASTNKKEGLKHHLEGAALVVYCCRRAPCYFVNI